MIPVLTWWALTATGMILFGLGGSILTAWKRHRLSGAGTRRIAALRPLSQGRKAR